MTEPHLKAMESVVVELTAQLSQLSAQLKLFTAQGQPPGPKSSPWLPLKEAAPLLHFSSARALKNRILAAASRPTASGRCPHLLASATLIW